MDYGAVIIDMSDGTVAIAGSKSYATTPLIPGVRMVPITKQFCDDLESGENQWMGTLTYTHGRLLFENGCLTTEEESKDVQFFLRDSLASLPDLNWLVMGLLPIQVLNP
jgi:hypothetical protein